MTSFPRHIATLFVAVTVTLAFHYCYLTRTIYIYVYTSPLDCGGCPKSSGWDITTICICLFMFSAWPYMVCWMILRWRYLTLGSMHVALVSYRRRVHSPSGRRTWHCSVSLTWTHIAVLYYLPVWLASSVCRILPFTNHSTAFLCLLAAWTVVRTIMLRLLCSVPPSEVSYRSVALQRCGAGMAVTELPWRRSGNGQLGFNMTAVAGMPSWRGLVPNASMTLLFCLVQQRTWLACTECLSSPPQTNPFMQDANICDSGTTMPAMQPPALLRRGFRRRGLLFVAWVKQRYRPIRGRAAGVWTPRSVMRRWAGLPACRVTPPVLMQALVYRPAAADSTGAWTYWRTCHANAIRLAC